MCPDCAFILYRHGILFGSDLAKPNLYLSLIKYENTVNTQIVVFSAVV